MRNRKNKLTIILLVFLMVYVVNSFFTVRMLTGKYANRNFENGFISEIPHVNDTLIIKDNYEFESSFFGKGKYELKYSFSGTKINLLYGEGYSSTNINGKEIRVSNKAVLSTYINRILFFGNPKIILCEDLDQYYEKIE